MSLVTASAYAKILWNMDGAANSAEPDEVGATTPTLLDNSSNLGVGSTIFGRTATRLTSTGDTSYFVASSHADFNTSGDISFSLRMLVRLNSIAAVNALCSIRNGTDRAFMLYVYTDGIVYGEISSAAGSTGNHTATSAGTLSTATDYHIVLTYDAAADLIRVYVNGSGGTAVTHAGGAYYNNADLYVGRDSVNDYNGNYSVSEIIFLKSYCLSQAEVTADLNGGTPLALANWFTGLGDLAFSYATANWLMDGTGNETDTISGIVLNEVGAIGTTTVFGTPARTMVTDGSNYLYATNNDYLRIDDKNWWCRLLLQINALGTAMYIFFKGGGSEGEWLLWLNNVDNHLHFYIYKTASTYEFVDFGVVAANTPYDVWLIHDATNNVMKMAVNGEISSPVAITGGAFVSTNLLTFRLPTGGGESNTRIGEIVIGEGRLPTPQEIITAYNNGTPYLFAQWPSVTGVAAAVTGTAAADITEADVVAGGKTIIITLTGDTWIGA